MNRRDVLKLFGVGAAIIPAASAFESDAPVARLIEPAKFELVEKIPPVVANAGSMYSFMDYSGQTTLKLTTRTREGGREVVYTATGYVTRVDTSIGSRSLIDVTSMGDHQRFIQGCIETEIRFVCSGNPLVTMERS